MKTVGMFEAKNTLSELVSEYVAKGETVTLTRNGRPVAREAVDWILARHWRLDGLTIRELIDDGKRL